MGAEGMSKPRSPASSSSGFDTTWEARHINLHEAGQSHNIWRTSELVVLTYHDSAVNTMKGLKYRASGPSSELTRA